MSRQVESSHSSASRGISEVTSVSGEDHTREGLGRLSSGRVVSAVGAVLKRPHTKVGQCTDSRVNLDCSENITKGRV